MRFSEKEKLSIVEEGEKNGVKAVCAKYGTSTQSYRLWRYKINGTRPNKQRSRTEKLSEWGLPDVRHLGVVMK